MQVDLQHRPFATARNLKIAASLRGLHYAECKLLSRHGDIGLVAAGDLKEYTAVRPSLVRSTSGVQEARTESAPRKVIARFQTIQARAFQPICEVPATDWMFPPGL